MNPVSLVLISSSAPGCTLALPRIPVMLSRSTGSLGEQILVGHFGTLGTLDRYTLYFTSLHPPNLHSSRTKVFLPRQSLRLKNLHAAAIRTIIYLLNQFPIFIMAQTPEQRKRNAKFTKEQNAKRGKPAQELQKKQSFKSPVSPMVLGILGFVVFGGLLFELLSRFFLS
ncbi:hypothetical protein VTL71DRAFT_15011 [Oculimacula yallundae]|uniref:Stress-associated endoplasmic reticulum protein n=1 Tax=Oculimacula yallundae TaxID=86028 RepID=A0ABR4CFD7_9HELO